MSALSGQIALVTGASKGIGAAVAKALAAAGAHVVITARDTKGLEAVEEAIFQAGGGATIAPVDLADADGIARLAAAVTERWKKLDVLVHCAAVLPELTSVRDIDQTQFSKALTLNVLATQALIARFDPLLKASEDPRFVHLTTSVASDPRAYWGAYAASKAAAENLVSCYAEEARNTSKVRVAIVDPGATRTAMRAKAYPGEDPASVKPPEAVAERLLTLLGEQFSSPHRERVNLSS
ncbi:SDR family NAD(P)-dependent oxidoreductase [Novosphingobium sp.]|uniref:SDR family NAD(P)-dependent oxidoreductase n=1 Tax=Novosphingobium sp. TaxID=1874826 RepID=UPI0025E5F52F|nr:SDR family NAD(P)-dependent oxidoreductase [Novosphingobium sp.]MCC6925371.1 SDR family NAD(P)-dependent oxidoreductase [Novosphingobium sp.]